jgi:hypothetical protein
MKIKPAIVFVALVILPAAGLDGPAAADERLANMHVIDWHAHVAGLGHGGSGAFINEQMRNKSQKLTLPLRHGVTVIAAHLAATGKSEGQDNFERILKMFAAYPNLYADISSLTQINRLGYLVKALKAPGLTERLLYGSDWPLQFFPLVSPWFHVHHIGGAATRQVAGIGNPWDRDVGLKQALGVPPCVFSRVVGIPATKHTKTRQSAAAITRPERSTRTPDSAPYRPALSGRRA